jgi:starch-binding outer membrane protein, SusD/RagB family
MYSAKYKAVDQPITQTPNNKYAVGFLVCMTGILVLFLISCRKFVELDSPPDKLTQENVFANDRTAAATLTSMYMDMVGSGADMAKYGGLLSDEFTLWSGADFIHVAYYSNSFLANPTMNTGKDIWETYYPLIFRCNAAIEGLTANNSLTPSIKKQLLGEAYFLRAWFYFYLVNLYGNLPLVVSTDPAVNRLLFRSSTQDVYQLIIEDLLQAQESLSADYVNGQMIPYTSGTPERVRPTRWAATAFMARVYLYSGDYVKAEMTANDLISNTTLFNLVSNAGVFLKNSREAIWQLQPTETGWNTREARQFHLAAVPSGLSGNKPIHLSSFLLASFESGDQRRKLWVDSQIVGTVTYYFPAKYKIGAQNSTVTSPATLTEYSMMLRLGEQYLIRAEARARQNKLPGAIADLDSIRKRANLPLISITNPGISQNSLLSKIGNERQVELFTEWGLRWFDLKRSGQIDAVMQIVTPAKGGAWESNDQLLPIPYNEFLYNPSLTQNLGYQ